MESAPCDVIPNEENPTEAAHTLEPRPKAGGEARLGAERVNSIPGPWTSLPLPTRHPYLPFPWAMILSLFCNYCIV